MKILAIDTASKRCSVAILEKEKIIDEINLDDGRTHSENLMPIVEHILEKNDLTLSQVDCIACCTGPGSFTGIRIGVSSVKAMAQVHQIPVIGVTSLEVLARNDISDKIKISLLDARNNQVYCGVFDKEYQKIEEFVADDIENVISVLKRYEAPICVGNGAILHKNLLQKELSKVEFCNENEQRAGLCGSLAYQKYLKNEWKSADTILPFYLRKSQAERNKDRSI